MYIRIQLFPGKMFIKKHILKKYENEIKILYFSYGNKNLKILNLREY